MILNPFTLNNSGGSDSFKRKFSNYYTSSGTKTITPSNYNINVGSPAIVYIIPMIEESGSSGTNQHVYQTMSYLPKVRSTYQDTLCMINGNGKGSSFASTSYDSDNNIFSVTLYESNCLIQVYQ